jgi:ADP-ribosylglycohydrolase
MNTKDRFLGCMYGLAIGDALGAPVEFDVLQIGGKRVSTLSEWRGHPAGYYTDDTQMSLATCQGIIDAAKARDKRPTPYVYKRYLEWLESQKTVEQQRAPGRTCIQALKSGKAGSIEERINNSKGCGGVMRTAPIGLFYKDPQSIFRYGAECAALTHGHPSGYLSAGYLSHLIYIVSRTEFNVKDAAVLPMILLHGYEGHEEMSNIMLKAIDYSEDKKMSVEDAINRLGQGWVGEEALAVSLYSALKYSDDWKAAVLAAINYSGDSDSCGSITGAILGAALGISAIPYDWVQKIENAHLIGSITENLWKYKEWTEKPLSAEKNDLEI